MKWRDNEDELTVITPIGSNLHIAMPNPCGNFGKHGVEMEGLAEGQCVEVHKVLSPLREDRRHPGAVPSLALTQQSGEHEKRTQPRSESTLCLSHVKRYDNWRGTQEGQILRWLLWPYSVGILPEQQLSNDFACWHTHDTQLSFIWELSRFLISLHLSLLYFDKTALDKSVFFYAHLCLIASMMHLGERISALQPECSYKVPKCKLTMGFGHAPGTVAGKAWLCFGL